MRFYFPDTNAQPVALPLIAYRVPAGFPSPAAEYIEKRIDLNNILIKNPSFTFFAYAEGDSMTPMIGDGDLMVVDRKEAPVSGMIVLASVNNEFCVKRLFRFPDGSLELRPENSKYPSINLPSEFDGEFEIFGAVTYAVKAMK